MNNLEQLTKKIQQAVPSIMKLEMGCWVNFKRFNNEPNKFLLKHYERAGIWRYSFMDDTKNNSASVRTFDEGGDLENFGRDIQIGDVMIALNKKQLKDGYGDREFVMINDNGMIQTDLYNWEEEPLFWRMKEPLHQQPQEVINQLNKII